MSSPDIPPPPPPPQEMKQPETQAMKESARRNRASGAMGVSSLLTGPSGLSAGVSTGRSSLLGQ
jgi:hypothetical protein